MAKKIVTLYVDDASLRLLVIQGQRVKKWAELPLEPALVNPRGMGWGDVKMAALIGLVTGFPLVLVALVTGVVLGGLVALILLLLRIKKRKETIPFGPFLSIATIATLLWGSHILDWYLGFFL